MLLKEEESVFFRDEPSKISQYLISQYLSTHMKNTKLPQQVVSINLYTYKHYIYIIIIKD